jgi:polar amino acid transport system substrate-binding protein
MMENIRTSTLMLSVLLMLIFAPLAFSASPFKIVGLDVEPYFISSGDGQISGIFYDALIVAANNADIDLEIQTLPWGRAQIEVKQGRVDAILPVVKTPERESFLFYPERPIDHFDFSIFTHNNNTLEFTGDLEQLRGLTIGKILGGKMHPNYHKALAQGVFLEERRRTIDQLSKGVSLGRIDAFTMPKLMGLWSIKKLKITNLKVHDKPYGVASVFIALSKKSQNKDVWQVLLSEIERMIDSGEYQKITDNYIYKKKLNQ